ncbi:MAG: amidohydrolase family protein [Pseudomonadota bacterium]
MVTPGYLAYHPDPKKPDASLPPGSCDSHCHVFGPGDQFPFSPTSTYVPVDAGCDTLFARHRFLGIDRAVIVQASCHGSNNDAMIHALQQGRDNYRGVAVVDRDISPAELETMHEAGVRGVRFNFVKRLGSAKPLDHYRDILSKIKPLGWHIIVYFDAEDLVEIEPFFESIEVPVVVDHMGRVPVEGGTDSDAYKLLEKLLTSSDKYWVKISCAERLTRTGPPYADVDPIARALISSVSDRVLWGTDWPHPNMKSHMPDDGQLVDRIMQIADTAALRQKILIDNPTRLYWS